MTTGSWCTAGRRENQFLPTNFRSGPDPNAAGDMAGKVTTFLTAGMDGYFTDNPDIGVAAVDDFEDDADDDG